jgi:hypothetical protein
MFPWTSFRHKMNFDEGYLVHRRQWNWETTTSSPPTYIIPTEETFYDTIRQLYTLQPIWLVVIFICSMVIFIIGGLCVLVLEYYERCTHNTTDQFKFRTLIEDCNSDVTEKDPEKKNEDATLNV